MVRAPRVEHPEPLSIGIWNVAESYRLAAMAVLEHRPPSMISPLPIRFLFKHAIGLHFKAHLHGTGVSSSALKARYGHDTSKLLSGAIAAGS